MINNMASFKYTYDRIKIYDVYHLAFMRLLMQEPEEISQMFTDGLFFVTSFPDYQGKIKYIMLSNAHGDIFYYNPSTDKMELVSADYKGGTFEI